MEDFFTAAITLRAGWTSSISSYVTYKTVNFTPSVNVWHHVAWTIDWTTNPDTVISCFDGGCSAMTLVEGGNNTSPTTGATQQALLGTFVSQANRYWNGDLADAAAWNAILTAQEITALAARQRPNKLGRPMLYYLPLDGSLTAEPDYSGNGCLGTVTGAARSNNPPLVPF
jgi:hypothetical protein